MEKSKPDPAGQEEKSLVLIVVPALTHFFPTERAQDCSSCIVIIYIYTGVLPWLLPNNMECIIVECDTNKQWMPINLTDGKGQEGHLEANLTITSVNR